ncbi:MAG: exodeoxyribonuclease VII large subunit [Saprospiraceae bacterium]|nr:exodeoxyribonuclease VII large subunit [Saprospiraceae bacterium]
MGSTVPTDVQSLFGLHTFIRQVLALNFQEAVWVRAEIASAQEVRGHIFLNLVEKAEAQVRAQAPAVVWMTTYRKLRRQYGKRLEGVLQTGMEVQLQVEVNFHEQFGYKLIIQDIDLEFTIGNLEQKRLATIEKLRAAGLLEKNKSLPLPRVIQRIALISSPNAAGLEDFLQQIRENAYGYQFNIELFPASVQGENAVKDILHQFQAIRRKADKFDCIALLRGGGARTDLLAFDEEALCKDAAELPLPLLSGIGHERDESILDLVSNKSLKTPTAVAEFILSHNVTFEAEILNFEQEILDIAQSKSQNQRLLLSRIEDRLESIISRRFQKHRFDLTQMADRIQEKLYYRIRIAGLELHKTQEILQLLGPEASLNRGYVRLTNAKGEAIISLKQIKQNQELQTGLKDGILIVKVDRKKQT